MTDEERADYAESIALAEQFKGGQPPTPVKPMTLVEQLNSVQEALQEKADAIAFVAELCGKTPGLDKALQLTFAPAPQQR